MPDTADLALPDAQAFDFAFDRRYRWAARPFGVRPETAVVTIDGEALTARFGPWTVTTPIANITDAQASGPFSLPRTIGPAHLSLADRGLTFATNPDRAVCLTFAEPVRGMDPLGVLRHPGLTVTVADVDGFLEAVADARRTEPDPAEEQAARDDLHTMTASQLRHLAAAEGVDHPASLKKAELVALLEDHFGPDLVAEVGSAS